MVFAVFLLAAIPVMAAGPASPAKADKSQACPKGQVEITSKLSGARFCAAMGGVTMMGGGPQPILIPEKPAGNPKK
jgi:hypothetical protein